MALFLNFEYKNDFHRKKKIDKLDIEAYSFLISVVVIEIVSLGRGSRVLEERSHNKKKTG